jgi:hypothetical protein
MNWREKQGEGNVVFQNTLRGFYKKKAEENSWKSNISRGEGTCLVAIICQPIAIPKL